jgi:NTP pyrophosphatase (non-canonical NTP hydrolase)
VETLTRKIGKFVKERDWEQFHSPKNIAISISLESSELLEIFQWSRGLSWSEFENDRLKSRAEEELSDVLIYLIRFADLAGIDLEKSAIEKIEKNKKKYPIEKFKGSDKKHDDL